MNRIASSFAKDLEVFFNQSFYLESLISSCPLMQDIMLKFKLRTPMASIPVISGDILDFAVLFGYAVLQKI